MEEPVQEFDLVVRGGTVVTASQTMACDVGVRNGKVAALTADLPAGRQEIDTSDRLVLRRSPRPKW